MMLALRLVVFYYVPLDWRVDGSSYRIYSTTKLYFLYFSLVSRLKENSIDSYNRRIAVRNIFIHTIIYISSVTHLFVYFGRF